MLFQFVVVVSVLFSAALGQQLSNGTFAQTFVSCNRGKPDTNRLLPTWEIRSSGTDSFVIINVLTVAGEAGGKYVRNTFSGAVTLIVPPADQGDNFELCVGLVGPDRLTVLCDDDMGASCTVVYQLQHSKH
jgi:hypothetical protein